MAQIFSTCKLNFRFCGRLILENRRFERNSCWWPNPLVFPFLGQNCKLMASHLFLFLFRSFLSQLNFACILTLATQTLMKFPIFSRFHTFCKICHYIFQWILWTSWDNICLEYTPSQNPPISMDFFPIFRFFFVYKF